MRDGLGIALAVERHDWAAVTELSHRYPALGALEATELRELVHTLAGLLAAFNTGEMEPGSLQGFGLHLAGKP